MGLGITDRDRSDPGKVGTGRIGARPVVRIVVEPGSHRLTMRAWATASEVS